MAASEYAELASVHSLGVGQLREGDESVRLEVCGLLNASRRVMPVILMQPHSLVMVSLTIL